MDEYAVLIDVPTFLATYLPGENFKRVREIPTIQKELNASIQAAKREQQMYAPLVS